MTIPTRTWISIRYRERMASQPRKPHRRHYRTTTRGGLARETAIGALLYPEKVERPKTRDECPECRPCPFVGCKWNTYLDVQRTGMIRFSRDGVEPWDVPASTSCVLDVTDRGRATLEEIGDAMAMTRERARQIQDAALAKLEADRGEYADQFGAGEISGWSAWWLARY